MLLQSAVLSIKHHQGLLDASTGSDLADHRPEMAQIQSKPTRLRRDAARFFETAQVYVCVGGSPQKITCPLCAISPCSIPPITHTRPRPPCCCLLRCRLGHGGVCGVPCVCVCVLGQVGSTYQLGASSVRERTACWPNSAKGALSSRQGEPMRKYSHWLRC